MKLLPCPFCGRTFFSESRLPGVTCLGCFATGPQLSNAALPPGTTTIAWNNRPGEKAGRVEGLKTARDRCADFGANHVITVEAINELIEAPK